MQYPKRQLPNVLSLSRIPLAAIFVATYRTDDIRLFWASAGLIALALLSDFLDGYLARIWHVESVAGYLLDGLGDKVFYVAILLVMAREDPNQLFLAWALIARELIWYASRAIDPHRRLKHLRRLSLFYAVTIRIYFAGFLLVSWLHLYAMTAPLFQYYFVFGLAAVLAGYFQIFSLSNLIVRKI